MPTAATVVPPPSVRPLMPPATLVRDVSQVIEDLQKAKVAVEQDKAVLEEDNAALKDRYDALLASFEERQCQLGLSPYNSHQVDEGKVTSSYGRDSVGTVQENVRRWMRAMDDIPQGYLEYVAFNYGAMTTPNLHNALFDFADTALNEHDRGFRTTSPRTNEDVVQQWPQMRHPRPHRIPHQYNEAMMAFTFNADIPISYAIDIRTRMVNNIISRRASGELVAPAPPTPDLTNDVEIPRDHCHRESLIGVRARYSLANGAPNKE